METTLDCRLPVSPETVRELKAGDFVAITGEVFTMRDASCRRLTTAMDRGEPLPVELRGKVVFTVGPSPARPGRVVGAAVPTTIGRMVPYMPALLDAGVQAFIGKGELHGDIVRALVDHGAVYFAAVGGLGAILAQHIVASEVVAYPDLGPEAIHRFEVKDFPVVVIIDSRGENLHESARRAWRQA